MGFPMYNTKIKVMHVNFVTDDKTRVKLRPSPGVSGSDYINASHIDVGYVILIIDCALLCSHEL